MSGSKVLVFGNTKKKKQRSKIKTGFQLSVNFKVCERIGLGEKASPIRFDLTVLGIGP